MVKTWPFHCHGLRFDPWLGTRSYKPRGPAERNKSPPPAACWGSATIQILVVRLRLLMLGEHPAVVRQGTFRGRKRMVTMKGAPTARAKMTPLTTFLVWLDMQPLPRQRPGSAWVQLVKSPPDLCESLWPIWAGGLLRSQQEAIDPGLIKTETPELT